MSCCIPMVFLLFCLHKVEDYRLILPDKIQFSGTPQNDSGCVQPKNAERGVNVTQETEGITAILDLSETSSIDSLSGRAPSSENSVVPPLILMSCLLSGAASGLSIRYFPVFFFKELDLKPTFVQQALQITVPLGQALVKYTLQHLARCCGASFVTLVLQWIFVGLLLTFIYSFSKACWYGS